MNQRIRSGGRATGGAAARRRPPADRRIAERRKAIVAARVRRRRHLGWALVALALAAGVAYLIRRPCSASAPSGSRAPRRSPGPRSWRSRGPPRRALSGPRPGRDPRPGGRPAPGRGRPGDSRLPLQPAHRGHRAAARGQRLHRQRLLAGGRRRHRARRRRPSPGRPALCGQRPAADGVRPGSRLPPGNELANALTALGGMAPQLKVQVTGVTPGPWTAWNSRSRTVRGSCTGSRSTSRQRMPPCR